MVDIIKYYSENADMLVKQYNKVAFESVHKEWLDNIPDKGTALDIGAGSGRDARFLASKGFSVIAVEPASGMRKLAQENELSQNIQWIDDQLPALDKVVALQIKFDLILLSAVWMHIESELRPAVLKRLAHLLEKHGVLVITLRYGDFSDERTAYSVSLTELRRLAEVACLHVSHVGEQHFDALGRSDVKWQTVCLRKDAKTDVR